MVEAYGVSRTRDKKGYIECPVGGCFDASYLGSKTRRGRLQGGGDICPTLMANDPEIYVVESID